MGADVSGLCARANVLMETTMRQPDAVFDTLKTFRDAGYGVEVRAIAVPETLSRLGTLQRYVGQVESQGAGRWAPSSVHNEAYSRMPQSLGWVIEAGLVDRVIVQKRDDVTIFDAAVVPGNERRSAVAALAAVESGRRIDGMTPNQAQGRLSSMEHTARFVADTKVSDPDILHTVAVLGDDAKAVAVAAATHPFDVERQKFAVSRVQAAVDRAVPSRERAARDATRSGIGSQIEKMVSDKKAAPKLEDNKRSPKLGDAERSPGIDRPHGRGGSSR